MSKALQLSGYYIHHQVYHSETLHFPHIGVFYVILRTKSIISLNLPHWIL